MKVLQHEIHLYSAVKPEHRYRQVIWEYIATLKSEDDPVEIEKVITKHRGCIFKVEKVITGVKDIKS